MSFFADQTSTVQVEFPEDGVVVHLKKYITAGIREDVRNQMVRINVLDQVSGNGASGRDQREARVQTGDFFVLQQMIVRVDVPDGVPRPHVPVSKSFLAGLTPAAVNRLVAAVNEWNPLVETEPEVLAT